MKQKNKSGGMPQSANVIYVPTVEPVHKRSFSKHLTRLLVERNCIVNICKGDQKGPNIALLGNVVGGHQKGLNIAGAINVTDDQIGLNCANYNKVAGDQTGINLAIGGNFVENTQKGVNITGFTNLARTQKGVSISGICNAAEVVIGGTISVISLVSERLKGFTVSLFAYTKELRGVIIAPITVVENSKSSKGLQIGLVNVRLDKEKWYNKYRPIFAISFPSKLERIKQKEILAEVELIKESKDLDKLEEHAKHNENSEIRIVALDRLTFLAQRDDHAGIYKLIFFKISEESEYDDAKNRANEMLGEFPYKR